MSWIELSSMAVAGVAIIGFVANAQRHNSNARNRIYERLDECKKDMVGKFDKDFARKDICSITHQQVERELKDIKKQTELIPGMAVQLEILVNGKTDK